ncbi:hypothetical protein ASE17_07690 [Phenylobacterium sp. Root77]|nr:hypothetical protein ASC73_00260 [Phenylobacterium sp. Root1277]KQW92063.1 hypothetical protein ASC79_10970 [Phenylobacterium sp. Root1290]KRC40294.1 hypothetical protein ASE17_07690 [Phenylobacterium sp. Root77]
MELVSLTMVGLAVAGCLPAPNKQACAPADVVRVVVDGVDWQIPAALQAEFEAEEYGPKLPYRWVSGNYVYCQEARTEPTRQSTFWIRQRTLRSLAEADPTRYAGLADIDLLSVGGPARRSALPNRERGEFYGPPLFGRPTVVRRQVIDVLPTQKIGHLDRLAGWAPGGVAVELIYSDHDVAASVPSVEALLTDLRENNTSVGDGGCSVPASAACVR